MTIAEKVRQLRTSLNLSRQHLAERANISIAYVQKIEAGERVPSPAVLQRLAAALGVSERELRAETPRAFAEQEIFTNATTAEDAFVQEIARIEDLIEQVIKKINVWQIWENDEHEDTYAFKLILFENKQALNRVEHVIALLAELCAHLDIDRAHELRLLLAYLPFAPLHALTAAREVVEASVLLSIDKRVLLPEPNRDPAATRRARGIKD